MSVSSARGNCSTGEKGKGTDSEREEEICSLFKLWGLYTSLHFSSHVMSSHKTDRKTTAKCRAGVGQLIAALRVGWLHRVLHWK